MGLLGEHRIIRKSKQLQKDIGEAVWLLDQLKAKYVKIESAIQELFPHLHYRSTEDLQDLTQRSAGHEPTFPLSRNEMFFDDLVDHMRTLLSSTFHELAVDIPMMERYGKYSKLMRLHANDPGVETPEQAWQVLREEYYDIPERPPSRPVF
jgi:hypothetical protein